jgi:hypothetical protein
MSRIVFLAALLISLPAFGQLHPEEQKAQMDAAKAKLEAKAKAREAERSKLVQITAGELADLEARVKELEAQLLALRGKAAEAEQPKAKVYTEIEVGMTKAELQKFIARRDWLKVVSLGQSARKADDAAVTVRESMEIARYAKVTEKVGSKTNALGQSVAVTDTVSKRVGTIWVALKDGVVTSFDAR